MSIMGLPRQLTEKQMKFAELLVYNEGRKSASECAYEAGYKTRPRQAASELLISSIIFHILAASLFDVTIYLTL